MNMTCSCCGCDVDDRIMAKLDRREDVAVCRDCLEQLILRVGASSTPTLPVLDFPKAVDFYKRAGFGVHVYDEDPPGFAFVNFDHQNLFDLNLVPHMDPKTNGAGCYIVTRDVHEWHARLSAAALPVTPVRDEPWGMHEFTLTDPSGNRLRIGHSSH